MSLAFVAPSSVGRFEFLDDPDDELDNDFVLFDARFDERDGLEDELPELVELISVVTLSVFGSVVEVCAATSALS